MSFCPFRFSGCSCCLFRAGSSCSLRGFALVGAPSGVVSFVGPAVVASGRAGVSLVCRALRGVRVRFRVAASAVVSPVWCSASSGAVRPGSLRFPPAPRGLVGPLGSFPLPSPVLALPASVASAPVSGVGASASPSSWCGSVLLLSSPAFVSAVLAGECPVSLALASFPGWPLRSGVLGALCAAGRFGALAGVDRSSLRSFVAVASSALGVSSPSGLVACWAGGALPPLPSWFSSPSVRFSASAVRSALARVFSCLRWLGRSGRGCPPACRPLLACLCAWCLRALRS